jgi:prevent-host-death family protein
MPATRPTAKAVTGVAEGEPAVLERLRRDIAVSPDGDRSLKPKATGAFSATEARKRLYALIDQVGQSHEPVQITGKRGNAVLLSVDDWRAIQETLHLVSIPGLRESILAGMATDTSELSSEPGW